MHFFSFFTDPILRAPTLGCMLMALSASLMGVVTFVRKRSLIGETLSHAAYPGVIFSLFFISIFSSSLEGWFSIFVLLGGLFSSLLGWKGLDLLEKKYRLKSDSALCLILSMFFGLGILGASYLQTTEPILYRQAQLLLYGQAATMTDVHVYLYGALALLVIAFIGFFFRQLEATNFDFSFATSIGIPCKAIERGTFFLLILSILLGIRSAGVVLLSGMLIAPAAAARSLTHKLSSHFLISALIGVSSGFLGNFLSLTIPQGAYSLPTGPMILLCSSLFCLLALLFAPKRGIVSKGIQSVCFRLQCLLENDLKAIWKDGLKKELSSFFVKSMLYSKGWIYKDSLGYHLTKTGQTQAEKVVRLHRLWEVYLVDYMGQGVEKVHRNAEELEHFFTPSLEKELTELLKNPKLDPHQQPIPPRKKYE